MTNRPRFRAFALISVCILLLGLAPVLVNLVVDPFDRDRFVPLDLKKEKVALKRHSQLYKLAAYDRERSPYLVLGDSRARALREKYFTGTKFPGFFNYSFGGGTLPEAFSAFWDAVDKGAVKGVVIGVPLRMFTERYKRGKNQMIEARDWLEDPWRYYTSLDVFETGLGVIEASLPSPIADGVAAFKSISVPRIGRAANAAEDKKARKWRTQLEKAARSDWKNFQFSEAYFAELERIAEYSRRNGIRLVLFIPPTPVEMQKRIEDFGRTDINFTYRKRLARLAPVVDFDFYSPWTEDREKFRDAYHFGSKFARQISAELIRFFAPGRKTLSTIDKRRDGVYCPVGRTDAGARVVEGEVTLLVGESCRVWIDEKEAS